MCGTDDIYTTVWAEIAGHCMANCSRPTTNVFCRVDTDVCAYPGGDGEVRLCFAKTWSIFTMSDPGYDCGRNISQPGAEVRMRAELEGTLAK